MTDFSKLNASLQLPCDGRPEWIATDTHSELRLCGLPDGMDDLGIRVQGHPDFSEIFLTAPNFNGFERAHPSQILYQGLLTHHPDALFGPQWMYSPPPLVIPVRLEQGWTGFGLKAPLGRSHFSGWSYRPLPDGRFDLVVHFDAHPTGNPCEISVLFLTEPRSTPEAVITWYADHLRACGAAPRVERQPPSWWREPMLCIWGEQCNLGHVAGCKDPSSPEINRHESQAFQLRWLDHLEAKGIPVGLVSLSDKWQLHRERLLPDPRKYPDLRGFADTVHARGKHLVAWYGLWRQDEAPDDWCLCSATGENLSLDPESPGYSAQLTEDVRHLISPDGFDLDGFFLDFTADGPMHKGVTGSGRRWGIELLHHYVKLIHDAAKAVKPDAMIMTHCCHPRFADVTDVLRLNDFAFKKPDVVEQARYRQAIARATSDWLINTDNWFMYSIDEWRRYLEVQPELGIPASWYAAGVHGDGTDTYEAFTEADYTRWREIWTRYRARADLF